MFNLKSRSGLFQMNMPGQPTRTVLFKRLFCIYTYFTNKFKDLPLKATEKSLHTYIWINYVTKAFKLGPKYTVLGVLNFWGILDYISFLPTKVTHIAYLSLSQTDVFF